MCARHKLERKKKKSEEIERRGKSKKEDFNASAKMIGRSEEFRR